MIDLTWLLLFGTILILLFAFYMGVFSKLVIKEGRFPGGIFIYYDYQGHFNNVALFHETLRKALSIDTSLLTRMNISYDDPFNLKDPRAFRASLGFFIRDFDQKLVDEFKKVHYQWTSLPETPALCGEFPYRNKASLTFGGATRFLPACLNYILRNMKRLKESLQKKAGTVEVIEGNTIKYYMVLDHHQEFFLTTKA